MSEYTALTDQSLMGLVRQSNHDAFSELVCRHTQRFYQLAYHTLQNASDAEDVVQSCFIKLWQKPGLWNPQKAKFTTWFYRVILHTCYDLQKKQSRAYPIDLAESIQQSPESDMMAVNDNRQRLEQAIAGLPAAQRDAVNLVIYNELAQSTVAGIMGISVKAVESLLFRARKKLHQQLSASEVNTDDCKKRCL